MSEAIQCHAAEDGHFPLFLTLTPYFHFSLINAKFGTTLSALITLQFIFAP